MESLEQIRLMVCGSRGGWQGRSVEGVMGFWGRASKAEKAAMRKRLKELTDDQRGALEKQLARGKGERAWGAVDEDEVGDEAGGDGEIRMMDGEGGEGELVAEADQSGG